MAIKAKNQVKIVYGAADLQLEADPGEAFLVKNIFAFATAAAYATLKTEKTTVGYFRTDPTYGNHLSFPRFKTAAGVLDTLLFINLLSFLFSLGIFKGYPVSEGEKFVISGLTNAADMKVVLYDIYEPADIKNTDPNGSKSLEYFLMNYGDTGAAIAAAGDNLLDNPLNPSEFPKFPFGEDVPAKHQILVHGICGSEVCVRNATPATAIYTTYLKLIKDREVLFDEDRNGIPFDFSLCSGAVATYKAGGYSLIGNMNHVDPRPPLIFPEPLVFDGGDELNAYITTLEPVDASTIPALDHVIAFIQTIKRITGA